MSNNIPPYEPNPSIPEFNAVYTIQLGELIENGLFKWDRPMLDWNEAAYSQDQYERVCKYFNERFYYREISMIPFKQWANYLHRKLVYELMPKYKLLYERLEDGINILQNEDEYYKGREIGSDYPETLLSENADYISDGKDSEYEKIKEGNAIDSIMDFAQHYKDIDNMLLDELESMFIGTYTLNINSSW